MDAEDPGHWLLVRHASEEALHEVKDPPNWTERVTNVLFPYIRDRDRLLEKVIAGE